MRDPRRLLPLLLPLPVPLPLPLLMLPRRLLLLLAAAAGCCWLLLALAAQYWLCAVLVAYHINFVYLLRALSHVLDLTSEPP